MNEETIFAAALEKQDPAERRAFLDQACAGDPALRQQIEELLQSNDEAGGFLNVPAGQLAAAPDAPEHDLTDGAAASTPQPVSDQLGETQAESAQAEREKDVLALLAPSQEPGSLGRLDHYEVLSVVGSGGMGVVLKARDTSLQRVVDIKLLVPQWAASGTARKRFVREAQAAAAVRDEHVVSIHAVQGTGPVPYLVMEYIEGVTLEDRIKQSGPVKLKEILRIGLQIAVFEDCENLKQLDVSLSGITDAGLAHFHHSKNLTLLEASHSRITDAGLAHFKDLISLTFLSLFKTGVSDAGLANFKNCKNLTTLSLSDAQISDEGVAHFKDCKNLFHLILEHTRVSDVGLTNFKGCKNLANLSLSGDTQVSDVGLANFNGCKNLATLNLNETKAGDVGLAYFNESKNLRDLHLSGTQVSEAGLVPFKDCKYLKYLDLRKTKVSAARIEELRKSFPKCQIEWD